MFCCVISLEEPDLCKGNLDNPTNGLFDSKTQYAINAEAIFTCNQGYKSTQKATHVCQADGSWLNQTNEKCTGKWKTFK